MTALVGGEVQRIVSPVAGFPLLFAESKKAQRQDLADLAEALGGGHQVGIEGVLGHESSLASGCCIETDDRCLETNMTA